ncbi:hypothetical protein HYPSUDRAFT_43268 [Hypholoma sublateritium FD-334 SS-4]|uniref:Nephrocystin 3-like N-terminal domain-containing protein n=1 Tax=Hypholoma sublateritium (strain FD-334 SS-4) TaxID=945553 RepID=A0A0D2NUZ2_HYPSF|nr:hypothetical protein HYPSUDRAFT_43268 [Hypholoma sublateritium FD-334 SS-4]
MAHQQQQPAPNAIFDAGHAINVYDGNFMQHNHPPAEHHCSDADDGFKHLQAHVATSAFDSAYQVDAPKCHPNTRQAVQDDIMGWILQTVTRIQWMLWLNGAAGAGKSAIARSIVALCLAQNIPIARFFFFRTDSTRNTIRPVVATLVHQLIRQIPDLLAIVIPRIHSDPLIFTKSLETQLQYLIFEPLRQLHCDSSLRSIVVLLFDGVDECDDYKNQTDLIFLISYFIRKRDLPIIAFFGSRIENQLKQIFQTPEVSPNTHQLTLDDHYLPDADIHLFLNNTFLRIKTTHPFKYHLDANWPDPAHVQGIVRKSSGQFIYASVVINFVSSPRRNPVHQLEIIRGLRPTGNLTPFAQLDALYRHIFSRVEDIDRTLLILACALFSNYRLTTFFALDSIYDIPVLLVDLSSVLVYEDDTIRFFHASLPDFLLDKTRSQDYFIDKRIWCTLLSLQCLDSISAGMETTWYPLLHDFLPYAEGTAKLKKHLLALKFHAIYLNVYAVDYLTALEKVDFGDDGELYESQYNRITQYRSFLQQHASSALIAQIESEYAAELVPQWIEETGSDSTAIDAPDNSRDGLTHGDGAVGSDADTHTVSRHAKVRQGKRAAGHKVDAETTHHRSLRLHSSNDATTSADRPATEAPIVGQNRGKTKKRCQLKTKFHWFLRNVYLFFTR